jgi:hypothetical protein
MRVPILPDVAAHLAEFTERDGDAFVFLASTAVYWAGATSAGRRGGRPRCRWSGCPRTSTSTTCATGNQLAAEAGATTKELMRRMGHSTVRAAMRYQHATDCRDLAIAAEMSRRADAERSGA